MAWRAPAFVSLALAAVLAAAPAASGEPGAGPPDAAVPRRAPQEPEPPALVIGLVPDVNVFEERSRHAALGEYLGRKLGVPVRFRMLPRHVDVLEQVRAERMDGAFLGSFNGALALERATFALIARKVNLDGGSTCRGYLFVRKDSGIHDVASMRGKRMAFVDRATTAGYVFPVGWLRERGAGKPSTFFREIWFTGSHDAAIAAVLGRKADVGAAKSTVWDGLRARDRRVDQELAVLATSAPVPSNGLWVRPDLAPALKDALRRALLGLETDPDGATALKQLEALRFVETGAPAADHAPVLQLARRVGIDLARWQERTE